MVGEIQPNPESDSRMDRSVMNFEKDYLHSFNANTTRIVIKWPGVLSLEPQSVRRITPGTIMATTAT